MQLIFRFDFLMSKFNSFLALKIDSILSVSVKL